MGKLAAVGIAAALVAATLACAPGASAAVRVGNDCFASLVGEGGTFTQLASDPGNPLPITIPSAGVVTRWTSKSELPGPFSERLKILRATTVASQLTVVGESSEQPVPAGINTFNTRIPVQAGDRLGLYGPSAVANCPAKPGDHSGYYPGDVPVGSTQTFAEFKEQVAVSALVEPDADNDGYGDETQDKCPQTAAVQVACPPLAVDAVAKAAGRSSVMVLVATSTEAPISVSGTVKRIRLTAAKKTVAPGAIASFKLQFPKALKAKLADLPKSRSLTLKVTAEGKSLAGVAASDQLTVKLKGRG